jgi:hypothetical protein
MSYEGMLQLADPSTMELMADHWLVLGHSCLLRCQSRAILFQGLTGNQGKDLASLHELVACHPLVVKVLSGFTRITFHTIHMGHLVQGKLQQLNGTWRSCCI